MIVASVAAAFLLFSPPNSPPPAAAPAPTNVAQPAKPDREVVFTFTYDESQAHTTDVIGSPPDTQTMLFGYSGTLTIDVLGSDTNGDLRLSIDETTDAPNNKKPIVREAILRSGGYIDFVGGAPDQETYAPDTPERAIEVYLVLPYLATDRFGEHPLQRGSSWQDDTFLNFEDIGAKYSVTAMDKGIAMVDIASKTVGHSFGALTLEERLAYKADLRVASSLDVYASLLENGGDYPIDAHAHYHFKLASDTADRVSSPQ